MRISDWSSDVCSSDLSPVLRRIGHARAEPMLPALGIASAAALGSVHAEMADLAARRVARPDRVPRFALGTWSVGPLYFGHHVRSEERRVGKVWVRTVRSWWSRYLKKKKTHIHQ